MQYRTLLAGLSCLVLTPAFAQEPNNENFNPSLSPSVELLEFLADFGEVDKDTYDMLEFHAREDSSKHNKRGKDE